MNITTSTARRLGLTAAALAAACTIAGGSTAHASTRPEPTVAVQQYPCFIGQIGWNDWVPTCAYPHSVQPGAIE
jgi:hypothetical protein